MISAYHAKYYAHELTRRHAADGVDLPSAITDAVSYSPPNTLATNSARQVEAMIAIILESNKRLFNEERDKLETWADDKLMSAEEQLRNTKAQIQQLKRDARKAVTLQEESAIQQELSTLERQQRKQRQEIFFVEDEIIERRDALIQALQKRLKQTTEEEHLSTIHWSVVLHDVSLT